MRRSPGGVVIAVAGTAFLLLIRQNALVSYDTSQGSNTGDGSRRLSLALLVVSVFVLIVGLGIFALARAVPLTTDPQAFEVTLDIPIEDVGYGVAHVITNSNLSYGEIHIKETNGLVLIDNLNEFERCGPCEWELFVAHPTADEVHVLLELTGWLSDDELGHGPTWSTPAPLPPAAAESIDLVLEPLGDMGVLRGRYHTLRLDMSTADHNSTRDGFAGVLLDGMSDVLVHDLALECPPVCPGDNYRQTAYLLFTEAAVGTLTVLNTGEAALDPELAIAQATGWVAESRSGEEWRSGWMTVAIQTEDGFDREQAVPVVEISGVTRGQDPREVQMHVRERAGYRPFDDRPQQVGDFRYQLADCDGAGRCVAGRFRPQISPIDWIATIHWAFFVESPPSSPPSVEIVVGE